MVIKADQRPTSSLKIQCGIETLDSGQIQRVSQQYRISRFIKGIVFQSRRFVAFIEISKKDVLHPVCQFAAAKQLQQPFTMTVIGQKVEVFIVAVQKEIL